MFQQLQIVVLILRKSVLLEKSWVIYKKITKLGHNILSNIDQRINYVILNSLFFMLSYQM